MKKIVSCFTNSYGDAGVWTAAERIGETGINHLELALRGHNFGGLVIPESVVITEKADDQTARSFCDHLNRHGVKVSGCNVGGADIRSREGLDLTERRIRFAARWFRAKICVSAPANPKIKRNDARSSRTSVGSVTSPANAVSTWRSKPTKGRRKTPKPCSV